MKKIFIYLLILFPLVFLLWYFIYPEHLGAIEAYSFFAWTPDYISGKLSTPGGIIELTGDYLSQFYRWREIGACIQTVLCMLVLLNFNLLLVRLRLEQFLWVALIPASFFLLWQLNWNLQITPAIRIVFILYIVLLILWFVLPKKDSSLLIRLSQVKPVRKWLQLFFSVGIVLLTVTLFISDKKAGKEEKLYAVENAAFVSDWNGVLSLISPADARQDSLLMRYCLLALSEKDMLTEHISDLDLSSPDCFYFYRTSEPATQYFNSLFYAGLGLYNESIHQLFEATTDLKSGVCFRSLRSLTDWFLKIGNAPLARKYLTILEQSSCHQHWIDKRKVLLSALEDNPVQTPDRSLTDIFIGAYTFIPEMGRLLNEDPMNKKKTDYLLCALLLTGDLERFRDILKHSIYSDSQYPLPAIYRLQ